MEGSESLTGTGAIVLMASVPPDAYPFFGGILLLLVLSGLISASEVAFFSLTHTQLESCREGHTSADRHIVRLIDQPNVLLATILILNNLVNVAIVTLSTFVTWQLVGRDEEWAILILTVVVTTFIVFFGEIIPKIYATEKNLNVARLTAAALSVMAVLLKPFAFLLTSLSGTIEKRIQKKGYQVSVNQLSKALDMTTDLSEDKEIFKGILTFGTKTVKQVMRSRIDISAVDIEDNFHELMDMVNKNSYSRMPVYKDTIDKIEGVLYVKDLLPHLEKDEYFQWQDLIRRNTFFVPETKRIDELLKDFQKMRVHMAIVVDEYGGTSGLITLEDIIEEIVGEINDEFDVNEIGYKKIDASTYTFEGKTSLNDFYKILGIDQEVFQEVKGDSESIGGLLLELFQKLPNPGEKIEFQQFVFTVVSADKKRIKSVRVFLKDKLTVDQPASLGKGSVTE